MPRQLRPGAAFSETEKAAVTTACERLIEEFLKPRFLPIIRPTTHNYPIELLGKWHGTMYRLIQRYRSGFPENLGQEFDAPSPASTGSAKTGSTFSGIATRESGSSCIETWRSHRLLRRSSPTVCSTLTRCPSPIVRPSADAYEDPVLPCIGPAIGGEHPCHCGRVVRQGVPVDKQRQGRVREAPVIDEAVGLGLVH